MLAAHSLAASSLDAGVEDGALNLPLTTGADLAFATMRVLPPTALELAAIQRASIVIRHPQYTVNVANLLGL